MNRFSLKDATQNLKITIHDEGYELHSPAGSACYDAWGVRTTVNGIPEYFPAALNLSDERSRPEKDKGAFRVEAGHVFIKDAFITNSIESTEVKDSSADAILKAASDNSKIIDTLRVKLELDTSDFDEQVSEFLEKTVLGIIKKELKPGGLLSRK